MSFTEHFAGYLADFAVTGTVGGQSVSGIFDGPSADSLGIIGTRYSFALPTADATALVADAALVIDGTTYTVAERMDDGTGWTTLALTA